MVTACPVAERFVGEDDLELAFGAAYWAVRALAGACGPEWVHRRGPLASEGGLVHECHQRGPPEAPVPLADELEAAQWGRQGSLLVPLVVLPCPPCPNPPVDQA